MSLLRPILNAWLRSTEKPYLARVLEPEDIRRRFERTASVISRAAPGTWQRPITIGGRPGREIRVGAEPASRRILYFHGGAYIFGSPATHAGLLSRLCRLSEADGILPDYRKAPEHRFPAAVEDAEAAWADLLDGGADPGRIVIGGDSAGGGLALALLGVLLARGHPLPAGVFAFSPLTDLTCSGESLRTNAEAEVLLPASRVSDMADLYLGDADRADPRASPLHAQFRGAPPVWLSVGDTEILLDDTRRLVGQMEAQGVAVEVEEAHDLPHAWPFFYGYLPEARETLTRLSHWIMQRTPDPPDS